MVIILLGFACITVALYSAVYFWFAETAEMNEKQKNNLNLDSWQPSTAKSAKSISLTWSHYFGLVTLFSLGCYLLIFY